jgi:hypothetical protein
MTSRYDLMNSSNVRDSQDNESYPDCISVNWNNFTLQTAPYLKYIEQRHISKLWLLTYSMYQRTELDDILLIINNVPYREMMEPGDQFFIPAIEDINDFITKNKK